VVGERGGSVLLQSSADGSGPVLEPVEDCRVTPSLVSSIIFALREEYMADKGLPVLRLAHLHESFDVVLTEQIRYLLLQVRNPDDDMSENEIDCFSRALDCSRESVSVLDLLSAVPSQKDLDEADVVLLGGSGDYSVAEGGPWLPPALDVMRGLYESSKPTFASCWGFQAMARAMGGEVVTDPALAEVGTIWLTATPEGLEDPVFGPLGGRFQVHMGHQDVVTRLPDSVTLLASSDRVPNQAYRFEGKPIYATQFHPELGREDLILRIGTYPPYLPLAGCSTMEEFAAATPDIPETEAILSRFVREVVRDTR